MRNASVCVCKCYLHVRVRSALTENLASAKTVPTLYAKLQNWAKRCKNLSLQRTVQTFRTFRLGVMPIRSRINKIKSNLLLINIYK